MTRHRPTRTGLVLAALLLGLTACESKLAQMSDAELQDHIYECSTNFDQSPGFAISCDNYRRECQRRRDQGNFVC